MKSIRHLLTGFAFAGSLLVAAASVFAQKTDSTQPPFKRFPTIPPFELMGIDNQKINRESLAKRKGTLIMYFSPDCHHCLQQTDWLKDNLPAFAKYNLVLATYQPMEELKAFYDKYQMASWKNLYIGRDEKFFLPPYFKIANLPFLALYDKNGNLLTSFEGTTEIAKVLAAFNK
ncbi:MAG: redoxin domain-containing protein [Flavihumibacter sp.]